MPIRSRHKKRNEMKSYCERLINIKFNGETSNHNRSEVTDKNNIEKAFNLGVYLKLADQLIHKYDSNEYNRKFTGNEEGFILLMKMIALERKGENESNTQSLDRLMSDKNRFLKIYKQRKVTSYELLHTEYWGTRQQLRAGKVIADWIDHKNGSLDPIFGVLLCPTAGRTGQGDSSFLHNALFDDSGTFAYHSAVHDGFGYLKNYHNIGPGYNYLSKCSWFDTENPLAGNMSGIKYWRKILSKNNIIVNDIVSTV